MNDSLKSKANEVSRFFQSLSREELKKINEKSFQANDEVYREFKDALKDNKCFLCNDLLTSFVVKNPCMHWLLRPVGFDKKHFPLVFRKFNYLRIQSYLRWMANAEIPVGNINDLEEEKNPKKVIEYSIKYKNLLWSFSCGKSDLNGHFSFNKVARSPHYHFQMQIDGRPFINYGDFHIPFDEEDLWTLPIILGMVPESTWVNDYGMGMQDMMTKIKPEELLNSMSRADDESDGIYHLSTFVEAELGKTISGSELADLVKKSKERGIPIAKLAKEMKNVGSVKTIISPGPRVPGQAGRKGGR